MKKTLIIGLTTLTVVGSALIAGTMYAASGTSSSLTSSFGNGRMSHSQMRGGGENLVNSLSGKISQGALTELTALMDTHKTKMDALRTSSSGIDTAAMDALRTEQKTAMDALIVKYPELKTALSALGNGRGMGERGGSGQMDQLFAGVSDTDKATLKSIHDEYKTKIDALKTEEKVKIDTILVKYPEIKTRLDAMKSDKMGPMGNNEERMGRGRKGGFHMGGRVQMRDFTQDSTQAQ